MADLEERGIATRQGTHSPVLTPLYSDRYGLRPEDFPNSVFADRLTIALPLFPQLTEEEQAEVISRLSTAY
jgi:perosamine synthetase